LTLAFALRGSNGLVIGADSRMSNPEGSTDTGTKFLQVNREVGIFTYGVSEVGYKTITTLVDKVNKTSDFRMGSQRIVHFSKIAEIAGQTFQDIYLDWFAKLKGANAELKPDHPSLTTGLILAGFDLNETNQFKVLSWESPKFQPFENPDILAAQWWIPQYLINYLYYFEMDIEQLKRLAVFILVETEMISPTVGGPFQLATVTLEDGFQRLGEKDIQDLICENQERFAEFRKILLDLLG
jgi:hypothetical protein